MDSGNAEEIGAVSVSITGDYGQLKTDFANAQADAQTAGQAVATAFTQGAAGVDAFEAAVTAAVAAGHTLAEAIQMAGGVLAGAGDAGAAAAQQLTEFSDSAQRIIDADKQLQAETAEAAATLRELQQAYEQGTVSASTLAMAQDELAKKQKDVSESSHEAGSATGEFVLEAMKLAGIAIGVETVKQLYEAAIEAYSALQNATIAITALTGSAQTAAEEIGNLRDVATGDALKFDSLLTAEQRAVAFGFSLQSIRGSLKAAADDAAATGSSFESVAEKLDRMAIAGNLMPRTLSTLGLSLKDVADAMGVTESAAKAAFAALDQSQRLDVLTQALTKFQGTAQVMAQSLSGQFQNMKTEAQFAFEEAGKAIAPFAAALLDLSANGLKLVGDGLKTVAGVLENVENTIGPVVGQLKAVSSAAGDLYQIAGPLKVAWDAVLGVFKDFNVYTLVLGDRWYSLGNILSNSVQIVTGTSKSITEMGTAAADSEKKLQSMGTGGKEAADALAASFARAKLDAQGFAGVSSTVAQGVLAIRQNISEATEVFNNSKQAYQFLVDAMAQGKATQQEVDLAWQNLTTAAKNANVTLAPLPGSMEALDAAALKLGAATLTYAGNQDVANAKILAENAALSLATQGWETARAKLELLAKQVQDWTAKQDGSARAAEALSIAQAKLRDQLNVVIEKDKELTQATDIVTQNQGLQTSSLTGLGVAFDAYMQMVRNAPSEANNWGIQIIANTGQLAVLSNALVEARAKLEVLTAKMQEGQDVGQQVVKVQKQVLDAQIALDQETAAAATGTVGLTDKVSLYAQILAAAKAKQDDLTIAVANGTAKAQDLLAAERAVTNATNDLAAAQAATVSPIERATVEIYAQTVALQKQNEAAIQTRAALGGILDAEDKLAAVQVSTDKSTVPAGGALNLGNPQQLLWAMLAYGGSILQRLPAPPSLSNPTGADTGQFNTAAAAASSSLPTYTTNTNTTTTTVSGPMETAATGGTYPGVVIHQAAGEVLNVVLTQAGFTAAASVAAGGAADFGTVADAASVTATAISTAAGALAISSNTMSDVASAMIGVSQTLQQAAIQSVFSIGSGPSSGMPRGFTGTWSDGKRYENGSLVNGVVNGVTYVNGVPQTPTGAGNSMGTTYNGTIGQGGLGALPTAAEYQNNYQQSIGINPFAGLTTDQIYALQVGGNTTKPAAAVPNAQAATVQNFDFSGGQWGGANPAQLQNAVMEAANRTLRTLGARH